MRLILAIPLATLAHAAQTSALNQCCSEHDAPSCAEEEVAECVCKFDRFCCASDGRWDTQCAAEATLTCGARCTGTQHRCTTDTRCTFQSLQVPCWVSHGVTPTWGTPKTTAFEYEIHNYGVDYLRPGSMHEFMYVPPGYLSDILPADMAGNTYLTVTQQNSSQVTFLNLLSGNKEALIEEAFNVIPVEYNETGIHAVLFPDPELFDALVTTNVTMMYTTQEFADSISVWTLVKGSSKARPVKAELLHQWKFPCDKFGLPRNIVDNGYMVCAAPHTFVEDKAGNLIITMKLSGGVAILHYPAFLPTDATDELKRWQYFPMQYADDVRPLPFYLAKGDKAPSYSAVGVPQDIFINSITTSMVAVLQSHAGQYTELSYCYLPASQNMRPGGIVSVPQRTGSIVTLYSAYSALAFVELFVGLECRTTILHFPTPADLDQAAFLHICTRTSLDRPDLFDVFVVSSTNDFQHDLKGSSISISTQQDALFVLRGIDPETFLHGNSTCNSPDITTENACNAASDPDDPTGSFECYWAAELSMCQLVLRSSTGSEVEYYDGTSQGVYFHRVICGEHVLVTELRADRLFRVSDWDHGASPFTLTSADEVQVGLQDGV